MSVGAPSCAFRSEKAFWAVDVQSTQPASRWLELSLVVVLRGVPTRCVGPV